MHLGFVVSSISKVVTHSVSGLLVCTFGSIIKGWMTFRIQGKVFKPVRNRIEEFFNAFHERQEDAQLRMHILRIESSGGGTRTPDTRIMIPLL